MYSVIIPFTRLFMFLVRKYCGFIEFVRYWLLKWNMYRLRITPFHIVKLLWMLKPLGNTHGPFKENLASMPYWYNYIFHGCCKVNFYSAHHIQTKHYYLPIEEFHIKSTNHSTNTNQFVWKWLCKKSLNLWNIRSFSIVVYELWNYKISIF